MRTVVPSGLKAFKLSFDFREEARTKSSPATPS
jgi:hypothetical protein